MPTPARRRPKPRVNDGPAPAGSISGIKVLRPSLDSIVPAYGPVPSHLYVLGERAGEKEYRHGRPFVGPSGEILRQWFDCAELDLDNFRRWNMCIDYKPRNPKPRVWEIDRDRKDVVADIACCQPDVIAAVGAFAMRWCLGRGFNLNTVHGDPVPVQIGDHKAVCVAVYHPANFLFHHFELAEKGKADVLTVARVLRGLIA
jgi:uracil-DNA glycosylase